MAARVVMQHLQEHDTYLRACDLPTPAQRLAAVRIFSDLSGANANAREQACLEECVCTGRLQPGAYAMTIQEAVFRMTTPALDPSSVAKGPADRGSVVADLVKLGDAAMKEKLNMQVQSNQAVCQNPKCRGVDFIIQGVQDRGADEGQSMYITCLKCKQVMRQRG